MVGVRRIAWPVVCALLLPLAACVGAPTSESAWRESADKAIGAAVSGLGTAQVVLESDADSGIPHSYAVVALTDAAESAAKETATFVLRQPPDDLHDLGAGVVRALSRASRVLVRIRTEFASPEPDRAAAAALLRSARAERARLDELQKSIRG